MKYKIYDNVGSKIKSFYRNVAKKYTNTWDEEDTINSILSVKNAIFQIENGLLRRRPTLSRWESKGYYMTNAKKWYFAYYVKDGVIHVVDACHSQNMHEAIMDERNKLLMETKLRSLIKRIVFETLQNYNREQMRP